MSRNGVTRGVRLWVKIFSVSMLIVILGVGLVALFIGSYIKDMVVRQEAAILDNSVKSYARNLEEYLARIKTLSFDVLYSSEIQKLALTGEPMAAGNRGFESAAAQYSIYLCLTDPEGKVLYDFGTPNNLENSMDLPVPLSTGGYWNGVRMVRNGSPYNNYIRIASYYQKALYLDQQQMVDAGTLRVDVTEMTLREKYSSSPYSCILADSAGVIASASNAQYMGKSLSAVLGKEAARQIMDSGETFSGDLNGKDYYFSHRKLPDSGWFFISYLPAENMLAGFNSSLMLIAALFSACLLVLLASMLVESFCITRPLRRLADTINCSYSAGKEAPSLMKKKGDEVEFLRESFESMKTRIDTLINQIYVVEMEEMDSRVRFLQAQINPHFLCNTLESIRFTARLNGDGQTETQIQALSAIVRGAFSRESFIPLLEEMDMAEKYLFLQKQRLGEVLTARIHADPQVLSCRVPGLILQPLIENCIEHGFSGDNMEILIAAEKQGDALVIRVRDNGLGSDQRRVEALLATGAEGKHVALYNINKRLQLYYGEAYGLAFHTRKPQGAEVVLTMPLRQEPERGMENAETTDCG